MRFDVAECQTQVHDFDLALERQHQIVRFDVAMDEFLFVGVLQAGRCLSDDRASIGRGQGTDLVRNLRQVGAIDQFHHQERALAQ